MKYIKLFEAFDEFDEGVDNPMSWSKYFEILSIKYSVGGDSFRLITPAHPEFDDCVRDCVESEWRKDEIEIYSVRRKEDGEIFTVGQPVYNISFNIKNFGIVDKLWPSFFQMRADIGRGGFPLNHLFFMSSTIVDLKNKGINKYYAMDINESLDSDLIEVLDQNTLRVISNKEFEYMTQSDFDLVSKVAEKFKSVFGSDFLEIKCLDTSIKDDKQKWVGFKPNKVVSAYFKFKSMDMLSFNKYQDDWWLCIIDSEKVQRKTIFGSTLFLWCDGRETLSDIYSFTSDQGYLPKMIKESVSDLATGLMTQINFEQFSDLEDEYESEREQLTDADVEYFKSKMKQTGIPYDSWGRFDNGLIFRLKVKSDYYNSKHYNTIKFDKYKDDWWLCEIISDDHIRDSYDALSNFIIDSREGLEEFFKWTKEPEQCVYFRVGYGLYESKQNEPIVKVLDTWSQADDFIDEHQYEQFRKEELPKMKWVVDQLIERLNNHVLNPVELASSRLNYSSTIQENEITDDTKASKLGGRSWDWLISVHKFVDEWWLVECYLPQLSSPDGGDHVYFVCDTTDGLMALPDFFDKYIRD